MRLPTRLKELFRKEGAWWNFQRKYKHRTRPAIVDNVIKMLSCGLTVRGYAVFQCSNTQCSHQKKVCFSCKSRFCPSCGKKLTDQWIEQQKAILPDTKWQHITFTMPSELWELFRKAYNRGELKYHQSVPALQQQSGGLHQTVGAAYSG